MAYTQRPGGEQEIVGNRMQMLRCKGIEERRHREVMCKWKERSGGWVR